MKYWKCPQCGGSISEFLHLCHKCNYIRREKDKPRHTLAFWKCEWCGTLNVSSRENCRQCYQFHRPIEPLLST
ncbi:MAG: hypothetical protein ACFFD8_08040 [Candidatus Thorarchaeota archaeon]